MATAVQEPAMAPQPARLESDVFYEIVNGQRVELPPMSAEAVMLAFHLGYLLRRFVEAHPRGWVATEMLFRLRENPLLERKPDAAFVSYGRWRGARIPTTDAWAVIPDLAVEVVSPTNRAADLHDKINEYLECGVALVWVIYPRQEQVVVYTPTQTRLLRNTDELDGGDVLPEFRLPVAALFAELVKPE